MHKQTRFSKFMVIGITILGLINASSWPAFARDKYETIEAQAFGTSTQMGENVGVTLNIYEFSTPADTALLRQAFLKGQNNGLANALQKMKAVGHVELTGTLGYDCSYIKMTQTSTGRQIVFVTNRQIRFGEAWTDSQTMSFNLTAGILELNDTGQEQEHWEALSSGPTDSGQRRQASMGPQSECLGPEGRHRLEGYGWGQLACTIQSTGIQPSAK